MPQKGKYAIGSAVRKAAPDIFSCFRPRHKTISVETRFFLILLHVETSVSESIGKEIERRIGHLAYTKMEGN